MTEIIIKIGTSCKWIINCRKYYQTCRSLFYNSSLFLWEGVFNWNKKFFEKIFWGSFLKFKLGKLNYHNIKLLIKYFFCSIFCTFIKATFIKNGLFYTFNLTKMVNFSWAMTLMQKWNTARNYFRNKNVSDFFAFWFQKPFINLQ